MSSAGNVLRLRENLADKFGERELRPQRFQATMGNGAGVVIVPGKPNYVYVRRLGRGRIEECLNNKSAARDGLPVIAGYSHESPEILQILEVDWPSFAAPGNYSYVQHHHEAHELGNTSGGDDVVWVQSQQFMPLLVYPTSPASMFVNVFGGWYPWAGGWHYFDPILSADLTPRIPPAAGQARYVLISVDGATELLQYTNGAIFPTFLPPADAENLLPAPPAGSIPVCGVYLPFGVTALDWPNLYDIRLFNQPVGGSVTPGPHALLDVTVHSDTATSAPLQGSMVIGNATPAWDDLVHPGAAGYALVSGVATFAWSLTPTWLGTHTWGSGFNVLPTDATGQALGAAGARWDLHTQDIYFEGATGTNIITVIDNIADALHIVDTGAGDIFLQIITTTGSEGVIFNAGGDDVDFTVQAVGVADALQVQGSDGQITLGALLAGLVASSAAGVLSILAYPGVAGHALVSTAAAAVWSGTPAWTNTHSFAAGIDFVGGSGANNLTVTDNVALALELRDAGGLEYLRINSTNANPYLLIDPAATGINVGIGEPAPTNFLCVGGNTEAGLAGVDATLAVVGGNFGRLYLAGAVQASAILYDTGGIATFEAMQLVNVAGYTKFRVLNDAGWGVTVDNVIVMDMDTGSVGFGTGTIPHGGVGYAKIAIEGANLSPVGPHVQFTTATDNYPLLQIFPFRHDLVALVFDAYYDGAWKSSDPGSSFVMVKNDDALIFSYDVAAAGAAVTWNVGLALDTAGNVGLGVTDIEAWQAAYTAIEALDTSISFGSDTEIMLNSNAYYDGAWKHKTNDLCANYYLLKGTHVWRTAPAAAVDAAVAWTNVLEISAAGVVKIPNLAGVGVRIVVAAADGTLSAP